MAVPDVAARLNLHRVPGRREWRGDCPLCAYDGAFILCERAGRPIGWCASCQDREGIACLLRADVPVLAPPNADPDKAQKRQRAMDRAIALWNGSAVALRTLADAYLTARGLPGLASSAALRFRLDTPHPSGGKLPALVALVQDMAGEPVAIHRTFLTRDGRKASVEPVKATLGPCRGGAIRLDPVAPELVIGEGIESSASAGRILGLSAWAACSAGNLARGLVLPAVVRSVVIAADADEPGERAAREAALRWSCEGRRVRIATPNIAGTDFNDLLIARIGTEAAYA